MEDDFNEDLVKYLTLKNLQKPALIVASIMCLFIFLFLFLLIWAGLKKLDANTEYTVDVKTDVVTYTPSSQSSPRLYLGSFKLVTPVRSAKHENCPNYRPGNIYDDGEIKFRNGAIVQIEKTGPNSLLIQIQHKDKKGEIAELTSAHGRCNIADKFAVRIELNEESPKFLMSMVGGIEAGSRLTYSVDKYFPLLKNGEVDFVDKSFLSASKVMFPPVKLRRGDTVSLNAEPDTQVFGLISAELDADTLHGVFHKRGGGVSITKPYSTSTYTITTSITERISYDSELALTMSITIFILGILGFLITTLIRLSVLASASKQNGTNKVT